MLELSLPLPTPASLQPLRLCSDDQLARRAARGDRRAFERHHQAVYRYCRSNLDDAEDAADALQNTMAAVLRSLDGEARTALHDVEQGRSMACVDIRELIGERDGRLLRGLKVRAHLRACSSCEGFRTAIGERNTALGIAAPPLVAPFAGSILHGVLGSGGGAAAGAGAPGAGAAAALSAAPLANTAVAAGIVAKAAAVTGAGTKAVVALAAAATVTGGAIVAEKQISDDGRDTPSGQSSSPARVQPVSASAGASAQKQSPSTASAVRSKDPKAAGTGKSKAATRSRAAVARAKRSAVAATAERAAKQASKVRTKAAKDPVMRPKKSRANVATAKRTPAVSSANRGTPTDPPAPTPKTEAPASSGAVQLPKVPKGQPLDAPRRVTREGIGSCASC